MTTPADASTPSLAATYRALDVIYRAMSTDAETAWRLSTALLSKHALWREYQAQAAKTLHDRGHSWRTIAAMVDHKHPYALSIVQRAIEKGESL